MSGVHLQTARSTSPSTLASSRGRILALEISSHPETLFVSLGESFDKHLPAPCGVGRGYTPIGFPLGKCPSTSTRAPTAPSPQFSPISFPHAPLMCLMCISFFVCFLIKWAVLFFSFCILLFLLCGFAAPSPAHQSVPSHCCVTPKCIHHVLPAGSPQVPPAPLPSLQTTVLLTGQNR